MKALKNFDSVLFSFFVCGMNASADNKKVTSFTIRKK